MAEAADDRECNTYIMGVLDTYSVIGHYTGIDKVFEQLCVPKQVTSTQALRLFMKYSDDHPEELHVNAPEVIYEAMHKAFPCAASK